MTMLNEWLHQVQSHITPFGSPYQVDAQEWDIDAWDNCAAGGAVCVDVSLSGWPTGDFRYYTLDVDQAIPKLSPGPYRTFIEVRHDGRILSNVGADRPLDSVKPFNPVTQQFLDQTPLDVTGTALERFHGYIFGEFKRNENGRMALVPNEDLGLDVAESESMQRSLPEASMDLGLIMEHVAEKEKVHI